MHPFYYPTTTIIIDDEHMFLTSLDNYLSDHFLCKGFTNTSQALEHIHARYRETPDIEHFFSAHQNNHDLDVSEQGDLFIKVQSTYWFNLLQSPQRLNEISVAVIDYGMPNIDGIELCRQLKNFPMKKIMLTGKADKELAVQAFNEKIIDSFILKQEHNIVNRLCEEIAKHTIEYFKEKTQSLRLAFSLQETRFLADPVFQEIFREHMEMESIEEYYVNTQPPGVLTFNAAGEPALIVVYDSERMRAHFEIAEESGAPEQLLAALHRNEVVPLFPTDMGYYHPLYARDWQKHVYPAQKIDSRHPLYYAKLQNADFILKHLDKYISLDQHRKSRQL